MWIFIIGFMLSACGAGVFYLLTRMRRFHRIRDSKHPWLYAFVCLLPLFIGFFFSSFTTAVVMLHLILFWALCDLVGYFVGRKKTLKRYYQGALAIAVCTVYLAFGWYNAHNVQRTVYRFETDKELAHGLRIVLIADAHLGELMSSERFIDELEKIQDCEPDLVVVCGDYVDDDTEREDLLEATEALGRLRCTYGTYYVFGNHDKGYMNARDFTETDLRNVLTENGITILEDEIVPIGESFELIGRQDRSESTRSSIAELMAQTESEKYSIVLNHQPNDYDREAAAGVDLVLSGHTHGGHIFPAGIVGLMMGANDKVYGAEQRGETNFVVTSGISGWGIPFKTFAISEYVVIDIAQK